MGHDVELMLAFVVRCFILTLEKIENKSRNNIAIFKRGNGYELEMM